MESDTTSKSSWPLGSLLIISSGAFIMVSIQQATSGLISDIADGLGTSDGLIAFSVTAFSLSVAISTIPMFLLLRRRSRKSVLLIAFGIGGAACVAASAAGNVAWFTVSRAFSGVAHALFSMASVAYIALTVESRYLGRSLTVAGSGSALAVWLGIPLITWVGKGAMGWRMAFLGMGLATFVIGLFVSARLKSDSLPGRNEEANRRPWWHREERAGNRKAVAIVVQANAACVVFSAAYFVVFSYIGIWLRDVAQVSGQDIVVLLLISGTGSVAGMAASGMIADIWGTKRAQTCLTCAMVGEALLLIAVGALEAGPFYRAFAMFLLGVPGGAFAVTQQARAADLTPPALQPAIAAGLTISGNGGMALAGMFGGFLIASGASWALPLSTVALASSALVIDRSMATRLRVSGAAA